jgi:hypothetical protein
MVFAKHSRNNARLSTNVLRHQTLIRSSSNIRTSQSAVCTVSNLMPRAPALQISEADFAFDYPSSHIIVGKTNSGKTFAAGEIIKNFAILFPTAPPLGIVRLFFAQWQEAYQNFTLPEGCRLEVTEAIPNSNQELPLFADLPKEEKSSKTTGITRIEKLSGQSQLLIFDDLVVTLPQKTKPHPFLANIITTSTHHSDLATLFLSQTAWSKNDTLRLLLGNVDYLTLTKSAHTDNTLVGIQRIYFTHKPGQLHAAAKLIFDQLKQRYLTFDLRSTTKYRLKFGMLSTGHPRGVVILPPSSNEPPKLKYLVSEEEYQQLQAKQRPKPDEQSVGEGGNMRKSDEQTSSAYTAEQEGEDDSMDGGPQYMSAQEFVEPVTAYHKQVGALPQWLRGLLEILPPKIQPGALNMLKHMSVQNSKGRTQVQFDNDNYVTFMNGKRIDGSNLLDLLERLLRPGPVGLSAEGLQKYATRQLKMPGMKEITQYLTVSGYPLYAIPNKAMRQHMQDARSKTL